MPWAEVVPRDTCVTSSLKDGQTKALSDLTNWWNNSKRCLVWGEEMQAKRLAKLSVKLLRTCSQINKGLEWHEKHVVVIRLLEYLHEVPDHNTGKLFLKTVSESFNIEADHLAAMQSMVSDPISQSRRDFERLFELDESFLGKRFGGRIIGIHLEEGNLFLLRSNDAGEMRVNHQEIQVGMVALLAPGGTLRDSLGGTLFHSELVAKRQTSIEQRNPLSFVLKMSVTISNSLQNRPFINSICELKEGNW